MAKKKTTKKPVSKRVAKAPRTTRATLDERNETLGKRRGRKPAVTVTTEPAVETVMAETVPAAPVFIPNYPEQKVEYTPVPTQYWDIDEKPEKKGFFTSVVDGIAKVKYWFTGTRKSDPVRQYSNWAFNHPMLFGIGLSALLCAVAAGVAAAFRYLKW